MYIRFITTFKNEYGDDDTGIFQAAKFLRTHSETFDYDVKHLEEMRHWFNKNLEAPDRFSKSRKKYANGVALSWFKSTARDHVQRMYDLKVILEKYDILVEVIKKENPGTILYEDDYQVCAIPFRMDKKTVL